MKKVLTITILVLLTVGLFVSCNEDAVGSIFKDKIQQYTVTFNTNGGSEVPSQEVLSGNKVNKPGDPTKGGYIFGGWYKEAAFTNKWNFNTDEVTGKITLYAKWVKNTIAGILSTVEDFPASENHITPPSSAWVSDVQNSQKCYAYTAKSGPYTALLLYISADDYTFLWDPTEVTPGENCYTASNDYDVTLEFHMADGVLTSFKCTHKEGKKEAYDGTYTAPPATP